MWMAKKGVRRREVIVEDLEVYNGNCDNMWVTENGVRRGDVINFIQYDKRRFVNYII